jgi:hypothetical protein
MYVPECEIAVTTWFNSTYQSDYSHYQTFGDHLKIRYFAPRKLDSPQNPFMHVTYILQSENNTPI